MRNLMMTPFLTMLLGTGALAGSIQPGPVAAAAPVKGANQFEPDVACGDGQYLAVWRRSHDDAGRIECARLDANGKPLDTKPVEIAPEGKWQIAPRVAFGAGVYLVTWFELRNGKDWDVYAARVSPEGKVLDPGGVLLSRTPDAAQIRPCPVFDGKGFIVVWSELESGNKGNYRLAAARVGADGWPTAPALLDVEYGQHLQQFVPDLGGQSRAFKNDVCEMALAVAGDRLLVVGGSWTYVNVFTLDLKPLGPRKGLVEQGFVRRPAAATDGKDFILSCWTGSAQRADLNDFLRVSRDAKLLDKASVRITGGKMEPGPAIWGGRFRDLMAPALAFDGKDYLLVWQAPTSYFDRRKTRGVATHLFARRISPDGTSPDPAGVYDEKTREFSNDIVVAGTGPDQPNCLPRLASDGKGHVLMVWEQHPTSPDGNVAIASRMITTQ